MAEDLFEHEKSDSLWIDEKRRRCSVCHVVKDLVHFRSHDNSEPNLGRQVKNLKLVTLLCDDCRHEEASRFGTQQQTLTVAKQLTKALAKKANLKTLREASLEPTEMLNTVATWAGGKEELFKTIAEVTVTGMRTGTPSSKMNVVRDMMHIIIDAKKRETEATNIDDMSHEEVLALCYEPAKYLLLNDDQFREEILNDPEIRARLLGHAGLEVIETCQT